MALISSLRSRRFSRRQVEATQPLIALYLKGHWFALPLSSVQRVLPLPPIEPSPQFPGLYQTRYQEEDLIMVAVEAIGGVLPEALLGAQSPANQPSTPGKSDSLLPSREKGSSSPPSDNQRYLAVVQAATGAIVGLAVDLPPRLTRVPISRIVPLPNTYAALGAMSCLTGQRVCQEDEPDLLILDAEELVEKTLAGEHRP